MPSLGQDNVEITVAIEVPDAGIGRRFCGRFQVDLFEGNPLRKRLLLHWTRRGGIRRRHLLDAIKLVPTPHKELAVHSDRRCIDHILQFIRCNNVQGFVVFHDHDGSFAARKIEMAVG